MRPYGRNGRLRQVLNLHDRPLGPLQQLLHFFYLNLGRRAVLMPHH